jgi:hypothetical protein
MSRDKPLVWAVFESDGTCVCVCSEQKQAQMAIEDLAYDGMVCEPLYRMRFLTERERVAVMWAISSLETDPEPDAGQNKEAAEILREMLLRTAAPINRKAQCL